MSVNDQPVPILLNIFQFIFYVDHIKLRSVCKTFQKIIDSEEISGIESRNIFECVLTDNVYYFKNYLSELDVCISSGKYILPYNEKFLKNNYGQMIKIFCKYSIPNSKIYHLLSKKNYDCDSADYHKCVNYIYRYNLVNGDLINIKKMISNITLADKFEPVYFLLIASDYKHDHIIDYVCQKYLVDINKCKNDIVTCALENNYLKLLNYMYYNNLIDHNTNLHINKLNLMNLDSIKFYVKNFSSAINFEKKLTIIFYDKIFSNNIEAVDYILLNYPILITNINNDVRRVSKLNDEGLYEMVDLLIKYNINVSRLSIFRKIINFNYSIRSTIDTFIIIFLTIIFSFVIFVLVSSGCYLFNQIKKLIKY